MNCRILLSIVAVATALRTTQAVKEHVTCDRTFNKVGCFEDTPGMTLLVSDRDPNSKHFQGYIIQWNNLGKSLHRKKELHKTLTSKISLLCRCSEKARREGYTHVAIRFYAECWASKTLNTVQLVKNGKRSNRCLQDKYQTCSLHGKQECGGKKGSEYIYAVVNSVKSGGMDGNWSPWSSWTECSATCGEGEAARERSCTNPEATGSGQPCPGVSSESKPCSLRECPAIADSTGNPECEKRIKGLYQALLYRSADTEGFEWHFKNCARGYNMMQSFSNLESSKERKDRVCQESVDHLYKNILRKETDNFKHSYLTYCQEHHTSYGALVKHSIRREDFNLYDKTKYPSKCHRQVLGLFIGIFHADEDLAINDDQFEKYYSQCIGGTIIDNQIYEMMQTSRKKEVDCKIRVNHLFSDVMKRPGSKYEVKSQVERCMTGTQFLYQVYDFIHSPEFEELYRKIPPRVTATMEI